MTRRRGVAASTEYLVKPPSEGMTQETTSLEEVEIEYTRKRSDMARMRKRLDRAWQGP